ncbi:hypothetical protein IIC65_07260 [Candidatus Sumerlaeota bacterium]|nr:hypothetical protein [Candidatus Sumerlaeota bacterium]
MRAVALQLLILIGLPAAPSLAQAQRNQNPPAAKLSQSDYRDTLRRLYLLRRFDELLSVADEARSAYPGELISTFYRSQALRNLNAKRPYRSLMDRPAISSESLPPRRPTPPPVAPSRALAEAARTETGIARPTQVPPAVPARGAPSPDGSPGRELGPPEFTRTATWVIAALAGTSLLIAIVMMIRRRKSTALLAAMEAAEVDDPAMGTWPPRQTTPEAAEALDAERPAEVADPPGAAQPDAFLLDPLRGFEQDTGETQAGLSAPAIEERLPEEISLDDETSLDHEPGDSEPSPAHEATAPSAEDSKPDWDDTKISASELGEDLPEQPVPGEARKDPVDEAESPSGEALHGDSFEEESKLGMDAFKSAQWDAAVEHLSIAAALRPEAWDIKEHLRRARRMRRQTPS